MKPAPILAVLLLGGCFWHRPGREARGDIAWHAAQWNNAIADYRAGGDTPRVLAKLADAEFQAGLLDDAAASWTRLGQDDPGRAGEAAAGLARIVRLSEEEGNNENLTTALVALHQLAPQWPLGRMANWVARPGTLASDVAVVVIPALLADAPTREAAEPLLFALAEAHQAQHHCARAVPILSGVLRNGSNEELHDSAAAVLNQCDLTLGLAAADSSRWGSAEAWFADAARRGGATPVGRRAMVGIGDVRLGAGDTAGAVTTWRSVALAVFPPDSLGAMALARLQRVAPASADSTRPVPPS